MSVFVFFTFCWMQLSGSNRITQRRVHNEICNLYSSSYGSGVIKLQMRWEGQVVCLREKEMHTKFCQKSSKMEAMWERDINGRIFLEKLCVRV